MPDLLLTSIEYGGYISLIKFIIFLLLFFAWLPIMNWVYRDARIVGTKETYWTAIVFGAGAVAVIFWLIIPVFIIGAMFYLTVVAAASASYVMHRNSKVSDFDRVLTAEHIKGLFANKQKQLDAISNLIFITANNNEVPVPEPKTPDFLGYKIAYDIFTDAIWRRVSDIAFSPTQQDYSITYYIDGAALKRPAMPREQTEYFIHFTKNLADLDTNEKRKPQKGRFTTRRDQEYAEWQVITAGSTAGEQLQLKRIIREDIARLNTINLTTGQYEQLSKLHGVKKGLFIVSGPGRTGVTTTFYAILRNHDPYIYSISTLERKPSSELPNITQNVFTLSDTGTSSYAKKLQSIVRTGPTVVGVADCADSETAQVACKTAREGKIVYVTLEADNVIKALGKWMKLVGNKKLAVDSLLGISNQRLLRKLCNECKQAYEPNKELLRKFNISPEKAKVLYRSKKGETDKHDKSIICENCQGTGFVGRTCVFEIVMINDELRKAVAHSTSLSEISTLFRRAKMLYLQEQALRKVIDGTTSVNEMVRVLSQQQKKKKPGKKT